jgi:hypothetical protein
VHFEKISHGLTLGPFLISSTHRLDSVHYAASCRTACSPVTRQVETLPWNRPYRVDEGVLEATSKSSVARKMQHLSYRASGSGQIELFLSMSKNPVVRRLTRRSHKYLGFQTPNILHYLILLLLIGLVPFRKSVNVSSFWAESHTEEAAVAPTICYSCKQPASPIPHVARSNLIHV